MVSQLSVLVLGATGKTGTSIINGLLDAKKYKIIAAVRPASLQKPSVLSMQSNNVEIRQLDLDSLNHASLASETMRGVDVVISAIEFTVLDKQYPLIDAAKEAGVQRFVPCDWGTACVKGRRKMYDQKLEIREYVQSSGIGYTFIDVGWWIQLLYYPKQYASHIPEYKEWSKQIYGDGNTKTAVTDLRDIGSFTARIIDDPRTINRYVFCWGEEVTQNDVRDLAKDRLQWNYITPEKVKDTIAEMNAQGNRLVGVWEYMLSMWVSGDNTIENAKKPEYGLALDARELYPDIKPRSFATFAEEYFQT